MTVHNAILADGYYETERHLEAIIPLIFNGTGLIVFPVEAVTTLGAGGGMLVKVFAESMHVGISTKGTFYIYDDEEATEQQRQKVREVLSNKGFKEVSE